MNTNCDINCSQLQLWCPRRHRQSNNVNLRQSKKQHRQKHIVASAARLFSSVGYRKTTIEIVAGRSNVSPATIYNNFENKTGLLLAVLIDEGEDVQQIGEKIIAKRQQRDADTIHRLINLYVDHPMEFMNKSCWREALAASIAASSNKFTQEYQNVDKQLKKQLISLVHALHEEQAFLRQVDPQSLGEIIWNNVDQMFTDFIVDEAMPLDLLKSSLYRQTEAILNLALRQP